MGEKVRNILDEYFLNLSTNILPAPVSALIETIRSCESAQELSDKFDLLKAELKKHTDSAVKRLPEIPFAVEIRYASIVFLYLSDSLSTEQAAFIEKSMYDDLAWNESTAQANIIIIQLAEPTEKSFIEEEYINYAQKLVSQFNIVINSVIFA